MFWEEQLSLMEQMLHSGFTKDPLVYSLSYLLMDSKHFLYYAIYIAQITINTAIFSKSMIKFFNFSPAFLIRRKNINY